MGAPTSIRLPLQALKVHDVLAEPVIVMGYTLYPEGWELSEKELASLEEWNVTTVEVYADPRIEGINENVSSEVPKSSVR